MKHSLELTCVSLKEKQSVQTLQLTVQGLWSFALFCKCCSFRENHSQKWFKILWSIHEKLTCVSLKEEQSVQILEVTVWSEWTVVLLWEWGNSRKKALYFECALGFYEAFTTNPHVFRWMRAVCSNASIHCAKWRKCGFTMKML